MNVQQVELNCKDGFLEEFRGYLSSKILGNVQPLADTGIQASAAPLDLSEDNLQVTKDQSSSEPDLPKDNFITLLDRVGRFYTHDFSKNNIRIIGDDPKAISSFSNQLFSRLTDDIAPLYEDVRGNIFFQRLMTLNKEDRHLIKVSGLVRPNLLDSFIKSSGTICILPPKFSKITSPLNGTVRLNHFSEKIAEALGGDLELRKLLIASLSEGEFLLIENTHYYPSGGKESVRRFITESEQSKEGENDE